MRRSVVADCRPPLVLRSRHERALPKGEREVYACPSAPVSSRDFSSRGKMVDKFELGRHDGARIR